MQCKAVITDSLGAFTVSLYVVTVTAGSKSDLSLTLNTELRKAFDSGNIGTNICCSFKKMHGFLISFTYIYADAAVQFINIVGSSISAVDCSSAPKCDSLGRKPCATSANTCGECLNGLIGKLGNSNSKCQSGLKGNIGSKCVRNADCLYNLCNNVGVCVDPPKECPSAVPGYKCSGHGTCGYIDVANHPKPNCTELDVNCKALCTCQKGYGNIDCSLTRSLYY